MTYAKLLAHLQTLNAKQLKQNVTVYDEAIEEMKPIDSFEIANDEDDVLDEGHPFLTIVL